jgi:hypothetical protein
MDPSDKDATASSGKSLMLVPLESAVSSVKATKAQLYNALHRSMLWSQMASAAGQSAEQINKAIDRVLNTKPVQDHGPEKDGSAQTEDADGTIANVPLHYLHAKDSTADILSSLTEPTLLQVVTPPGQQQDGHVAQASS